MLHRVSRIGLVISRLFHAVAPDPFVIAVLLLVLAAGLGVALGDFRAAPGTSLSLGERLARLGDTFREQPGAAHAWSLLAFSMQMCLVLVTGHALAAAGPVRRAIAALASIPRSGPAGAAMVALVACLAALVNWGLGLIVGALLARQTGASLARRGVGHHYPILCAAGYFGLMVWHGGLSGSAPLTMTTQAGAARTLGPDVLARLTDAGFAQGVPLTHTLFTPFNAFITLGLLVVAPVCVWLLAPRSAPDQSPMPEALRADAPAPDPSHEPDAGGPLPRFLERSRLVPLLLAGFLLAGLWRFAHADSFWRLGLNEVNAAMIALGLVLHGSPRRYVAAIDDAARSCGGIIIQFPIYAAVIAVMINSGLVRLLADLAASSRPDLLPLTTFFSACVINLFVPSGGGQWAVQGPIALSAGLAAGVDPGRMIMAVAYGDQLTNMLQPFWALPLLAITGVRARDIVGYTALVMVVAGAWIALGLLIF